MKKTISEYVEDFKLQTIPRNYKEARSFVDWIYETGKDIALADEEMVLSYLRDRKRKISAINTSVTFSKINQFMKWLNENSCYIVPTIASTKTYKEIADSEAVEEEFYPFLTKDEYESVRDQMTANMRDKLFFMLLWHGYTGTEICEMEREDVTITRGSVKIKSRIIEDPVLAMTVAMNNTEIFLYSERNGTIVRRNLVPTTKLIWVSSSGKPNLKSTVNNILIEPYRQNRIILRGKVIENYIPARNVTISNYAYRIQFEYPRTHNLTWWAQDNGLNLKYATQILEVSKKLYGNF